LVWIPQPQIKEPVRSSLNYFMEDALRTYGIERSYNRQYIYLRDLGSLEALLPNRPNPVAIDHKTSLRDLLRRVSFFHDFTEPQLRLLIEQGFQRQFAAEELVCRQGEPGDAFYIVLEGELAILTEPSGHRLAQIAAGSFCGEIALLTGTNRTATIQALVPTLLFVVDYKALQQLLSQHPDLAEQISQTLALRTRELRELGLLNEEEHSPILPVLQIRDRIRQLFGI